MINFQGKKPKLLVIGDLMIDHYLWGSCERISPEAPVQVINVDSETTLLGGAGNVINNLKALGAEVDVISVIGYCPVSEELKKLLKGINVSTKLLITEKDRISSKKSRIISSQQQVVRFDCESTEPISNETEAIILKHFKNIVDSYFEALDPIFLLIKECEEGRDVVNLLKGPVCHSEFKRLN